DGGPRPVVPVRRGRSRSEESLLAGGRQGPFGATLAAPSFLLGRARANIGAGALGVQLEQAGQDLGLDLIRPAVAPRLLLVAPLLLVDLVVEEKLAVSVDVRPTVSRKDSVVYGGVQVAQLQNVGSTLFGVMEPVVGLGQALIVPDHERGAEVVVSLADDFE